MDMRSLRDGDAPEVRRLLADFGLSAPEGAECGLGLFDGPRLLACGHLKDGLIQGLCVDRVAQGEGLMGQIVAALVRRAGGGALGVITRPEAAAQFEQLGFRRIASAEPHSVYLEFGRGGAEECAQGLRRAAEGRPTPRCALVLNANPFTLGHRYLVERAAAECASVFVVVVEEDASEFPFVDRLALVRAGTKDIKNVGVLSAGRYVVSKRTFPSYFTKRSELASTQGALDAAVFCELVAPALGASRRYVGTEPLSPTTEAYNRALKDRLPRAGIELIELPRLELCGEPVSASAVRAALAAGEIERARRLVPASTAAYFDADAGAAVIARLRGGAT